MKLPVRGVVFALFLGTSFVSSTTHAASVSGQGTWESTLQGRDLDGYLSTFEAYYDTVLNITWLADANYARTSGYDADGLMAWATANTWAASLNPYGSGITGWRLPTVNPINGTAYDPNSSYIGTTDRGFNMSAPGTLYAGSTASEIAHLFYNTLGDYGECNPTTSTVSSCVVQSGYGLSNTGPFSNLQPGIYWSATEFPFDTSAAWYFLFYYGFQDVNFKTDNYYAWAVHAGDVGVSAVPVPAALWLFGSGLIGLIHVARRKAQPV